MEIRKCGVCGKQCLGTLETCGELTCEQVLRSLAYTQDLSAMLGSIASSPEKQAKPGWDRAKVLLEIMFGKGEG